MKSEFQIAAALLIGAYALSKGRKVNERSYDSIRPLVLQLAQSQLGVSEDKGKDEDRNGQIMRYMVSCGWSSAWGPAGWCMGFAGWSWNTASEQNGGSQFWKTCTVRDAVNYSKQNQIWKLDNPQPGDLFFSDERSAGESTHVGVVLSTSEQYIQSIEGNYSNKVASVRRSKTRIDGYASLERAIPLFF